MLLGHLGLEVRVDHLIAMRRDRHAAWETRGTGTDLIQGERGGGCDEHGRNAFSEAVLHSASRLLYEATCGKVKCVLTMSTREHSILAIGEGYGS